MTSDLLPTLTRYISGLVTLHRYCLVGELWATLGVVTGGALVRLTAVIWVVIVVMPVVVLVAFVVVVMVLVGGALPGLSMTTGGLSGLSGRVGGPRGGGGGIRPVVFDGGRRGCLPGTGAWSFGLGAGGDGAEGVLTVGDLSPVRVGERVRGGVGLVGGGFGSRPGGGPEVRGVDGGERWVCVVVGVMGGSESVRLAQPRSRSLSLSLSLSLASRLV